MVQIRKHGAVVHTVPVDERVGVREVCAAAVIEKDRARTEKSFFVPKQEIVDNGYDLSINKYKKTEYKPVEYPPTSEIMAELRRLEKEVNTAMDELEQMLK